LLVHRTILSYKPGETSTPSEEIKGRGLGIPKSVTFCRTGLDPIFAGGIL